MDVNMRRLHGALAAAAEAGPRDFADLLRVPGVGRGPCAPWRWWPRWCTARPAAFPTRRASPLPMVARTGTLSRAGGGV
ncbi:hypothetical protein RAA17_23565 [Komagataeibacter rhaeticus]|nr:hypothetical protein [Komagataeibacter rhaeticus]